MKIGIILVAVTFLMVGFVMGMLFQQAALKITLIEVAGNLEGVEVNINFNETKMVDRVTENIGEILWDIRMDNCTLTEKGYCALECYENEKLIPCGNFTYDEHFCKEGVCQASGGCPDYYEILEGKTIGDCIREVEENYALSMENEKK